MRTLPIGRNALLVEVASARDAVALAAWARTRGLADEVVPGVPPKRGPAQDGAACLAAHGPNSIVALLAARDNRRERVDVLAARRREAPALFLGRP